jgi:hypothetical protein
MIGGVAGHQTNASCPWASPVQYYQIAMPHPVILIYFIRSEALVGVPFKEEEKISVT